MTEQLLPRTTGAPSRAHVHDSTAIEPANASALNDRADVEFAHAVHLADSPHAQPCLQLVFRARAWRGTPELLEPDRCARWAWFLQGS
ncbi:hypothetical protein J7F02_33100, partial [Streptomyces sp. ISL-112]|nr:hypothetical protein [Streptomyces sp. ISL-112]MBT2465477.1 hypothetical protein [Streptomyces sp. ISL-63]